MRNALHFYLNPDSKVRDLSAVDPESWPVPIAGSMQSRDWFARGFDLAALLVEVFGPKMKVLLTKFRGARFVCCSANRIDSGSTQTSRMRWNS
jgi:hypothetical protein